MGEQGWQPIETAPSDKPVLVFWMDGRIPQMATAIHSLALRMTGWWAWGSHQVFPTHWRPLPEPPKVSGE